MSTPGTDVLRWVVAAVTRDHEITLTLARKCTSFCSLAEGCRRELRRLSDGKRMLLAVVAIIDSGWLLAISVAILHLDICAGVDFGD